MESLDTLPKLIERLRDPKGGAELSLYDVGLECLADYRDVNDFDEVYSELRAAAKACTTVKKLRLHTFGIEKNVRPAFPIINILCKHLPKADEAYFDFLDDEGVLAKEIKRFKTVHVCCKVEDAPAFDLNPDLRDLLYKHERRLPSNVAVGRVLLALPFPSRLRKLRLESKDLPYLRDFWVESSRPTPFSAAQLSRLVDTMQVQSLVTLSLKGLWFSTGDQCSQLARGLVGSSIQDLSLELFTPDGENYSTIVSALAGMPKLESLVVHLYLDNARYNEATIGAFSIPLGAIVSGSPRLRSLGIEQGWKSWSSYQCEELAVALAAPSCRLKSIDISHPYPGAGRQDAIRKYLKLKDLGTIMSSLSAPGSSIERIKVPMVHASCKEDIDSFLSKLPATSVLQNLTLFGINERSTPFTKTQGRSLVEILSGWYCLKQFDGSCWLDTERQAQLETLIRLNKAGRQYLISPTRSQTNGIEVLVRVRYKLNDIYTHLLENPNLCDRGAFSAPSGEAVSLPKKDKSRGRKQRNRKKKAGAAKTND